MTYEVINHRNWTRTTIVEQFRQFIANAEADQDDAAAALFTAAADMLDGDRTRLDALNNDLLEMRELAVILKRALVDNPAAE